MLLKKKEKAVPSHDAAMGMDGFSIRINSLLDNAEGLIPKEYLPQLPFMKDCPDVHDWHTFEHQLWDVGEQIRQLIFQEKKELNKEQSDRVCNICLNKNAERGRQSFVLLLGKKRFREYAPEIAGLLSDDDIAGHAINTLYKMGTTEYRELIKPYLDSKYTWIRNEAKRYINRCN